MFSPNGGHAKNERSSRTTRLWNRNQWSVMAVWEIDKSDLCEGNLGLRAVRFRCIDVGPKFPISTV